MKILDTSFYIEEFVPEQVYKEFGENSIWFVNPQCILFAQWIKYYFKTTVTVNDWKWGGNYQYSGFRPKDTNIGADYSQHRRGNAVDLKVKGVSPKQVREVIEDNFEILNPEFGVTTIENNTPTWTHVDFRYTGMEELFKVNG